MGFTNFIPGLILVIAYIHDHLKHNFCNKKMQLLKLLIFLTNSTFGIENMKWRLILPNGVWLRLPIIQNPIRYKLQINVALGPFQRISTVNLSFSGSLARSHPSNLLTDSFTTYFLVTNGGHGRHFIIITTIVTPKRRHEKRD
ncbi:hypothetical protein YC2023_095450 [Brassica napus]